MIQLHKWSLTEINNMIPFERQIYLEMLTEFVNKENEKMEQANRGH